MSEAIYEPARALARCKGGHIHRRSLRKLNKDSKREFKESDFAFITFSAFIKKNHLHIELKIVDNI
ncbi:hypothetical protein M0K31_RS21940 [Enterobacter cloacae]|nr:hypothetical protein [Enterobacter cloacae]